MFDTIKSWFGYVFMTAKPISTPMDTSGFYIQSEKDNGPVFPPRLRLPELEVKRRSLLAEQEIIVEMESKYRHDPRVRESLSHHRKTVVREELRATILAMTYLKGFSPLRVEPFRKKESDRLRIKRLAKIHRMVSVYGDKKVSWNKIKAWDSVVPTKENLS